jgi:hypothetical protein
MSGRRIVVRYAKRGPDSKEAVRSVVLMSTDRDRPGFPVWHHHVSVAREAMHPGERIVAIIEGGYH